MLVHKLVLTDINNRAGYIEMLRIREENQRAYLFKLIPSTDEHFEICTFDDAYAKQYYGGSHIDDIPFWELLEVASKAIIDKEFINF